MNKYLWNGEQVSACMAAIVWAQYTQTTGWDVAESSAVWERRLHEEEAREQLLDAGLECIMH